jgi:hypothetical protein
MCRVSSSGIDVLLSTIWELERVVAVALEYRGTTTRNNAGEYYY